MASQISSVVRQVEQVKDKLNVLTFCFEEKHELMLTATGHNIYALTVPNFLYKWNDEIMMRPDNYTMLTYAHNDDLITHLPNSLDFDVVVAYERPSHYEAGSRIAKMLHIPLIFMTNQFPLATSDAFNVSAFSEMNGRVNFFGSPSLMYFWNMSGKNEVLMPGVNLDKFKPSLTFEKRNDKVLTVAHRFMQRSEETNFVEWRKIVEGGELRMVGHNPGISKDFAPFSTLHKVYQEAKVYLNTSVGGIFPAEIIEAMASGCVVVSLDFVGVKDFIKNGENGFVVKSVDEAKKVIRQVKSDKVLFEKLSGAARQFVVENCNLVTQSNILKDKMKQIVIENRENGYEG